MQAMFGPPDPGPSREEQTASAAIAEDSSAKPRLSRAEIGKLRRKFLTKNFGTVTKCGHKFHPTDEPHTNCIDCWEAYFMEQEGIRIGVESIVRSFGIEQLVKVRGKNFVKMYTRFVATHPVRARGDVVAA
jgi:hypothetical protein